MFVIMTIDYQKYLPILIKFCIFYILLSLINEGKVIKIDNIINDSLYQENIDFSSFETKYKVLAGALPKEKNEIVLVVTKDKSINDSILYALGLRNK